MAENEQTTQRSKDPATDAAVKQTKDQALSPDEKHKAYLEDVERLHRESKVNEFGKTAG